MSLDWATLRGLADMSDDIGVLSLYATADPTDEGSQPAWQARVRKDLKRVRDELRKSSPRDRFSTIGNRLNELNQDVEAVLDARAPGRGRAMFATLSNGHVERLTVQMPLSDQVEMGPRPALRPLLTAWSAAPPAGCVAVGAHEVRLVDIRMGSVTEVATIAHPEDLADRRELTGKGHATPTTTHHSSASHHDLFDKREEDRLLQYLHTLGPRVADHAREFGWECVVIAGDPKNVHAVAETIPEHLGADVVRTHHTATSLSATKLAGVVREPLDKARIARYGRLAERVRNAAMSDNSDAGSCGLSRTLAALNEGRVAHLLLSADGAWTGNRTPDGRLVAESETVPDVDPQALEPEPRLDERMIDMALREGARVTVLDGSAAEPLADTDGIGALLRW